MHPRKTASVTNGVVSIGYYSSSQTITIPAGATRAVVTLIGGGFSLPFIFYQLPSQII